MGDAPCEACGAGPYPARTLDAHRAHCAPWQAWETMANRWATAEDLLNYRRPR